MKILPNKCTKHKPKKLGYIQWFLWAEEQTKKGKEQSQCPICGYWFFPQEM